MTNRRIFPTQATETHSIWGRKFVFHDQRGYRSPLHPRVKGSMPGNANKGCKNVRFLDLLVFRPFKFSTLLEFFVFRPV